MHFVYKLDNLFRSIRVSDENSSVTSAIQNFNNLLQLWTFFAFSMHRSKPRHQLSTLCEIICYFNAFTDLFWATWPWNWKALRMNSEKFETWHGIIISPTWHVQKSRDGYGKNWIHFVYKLDTLFRSIRVSDENSSVRPAIQNFNNLLQLRTFFASSMQHSNPRHQLSTLSDIICYF